MDIVERTIQSYNKIASKYCLKTRENQFLVWEEKYIKQTISYTKKQQSLILDVGCGDGRHCLLIDNNGGRSIGIDLSEKMLKEAKSYYPQGDYRKMDMRNLLFEDNFFDALWASGSVYHVPKLQFKKVMQEFKRVLKIKGVLAVNFKIGVGEGLELNPKSYPNFPRYFAYYTEKEMAEILENYGFKELKSCLYPQEIYESKIQQMWFKLLKE